MRLKIYLLAIGLLWSTVQASAQKINHTYQHWYTYFGNAQLNNHWTIQFDFQARIRNGVSDKGQILNRAGLQYNKGSKAAYLLGYAFVSTYSDAAAAWFPEHRIYQQFIYKHGNKAYNMTHRVRLEERWVGQKTILHQDVQGWKFGTRLRYFNRTQFPLKHRQSPTPFYLALQNEFFGNLPVPKNEINDKFFDQNRFLVASGYAVKPNLKLEAGYMNHFVQPATGDRSMNHILHLAVFHNFSL